MRHVATSQSASYIVSHFPIGVAKPMCAFTEGRRAGTVHIFRSDWTKVTCRNCIEWRHA